MPDFRLEMPEPSGGGTKLQLAESKIISCCETWYPARGNIRGTDKRAGGLNQEYRKKAVHGSISSIFVFDNVFIFNQCIGTSEK